MEVNSLRSWKLSASRRMIEIANVETDVLDQRSITPFLTSNLASSLTPDF
jgi:hypothetical protein